jgi:L-histidine Nalpha-methyltransferase
MVVDSIETGISTQFAEDVQAGLSKPGQKELSSKYFYDEIGFALFQVITVLPEYGLTRADERLIKRHADEIIRSIPSPVIVAELGCGSGKKTEPVLKTLARREASTYYAIEISSAALVRCKRQLDHISNIDIVGMEAEYLDGLRWVVERRKPGRHMLVLFFGSSIGNFDYQPCKALLRNLRKALEPGDALLLSNDLIKPASQLIRAYDDALGVTAAFNLNLLARINRELDGDFVLTEFRHSALYNSEAHRIEMYLVSNRKQTVNIQKAGLSVTFEKDETIWTESSYKYTSEEVVLMGESSGFHCRFQWVDKDWPFAQTLFVPV